MCPTTSDSEYAGLCFTCQHVRAVRTDRGSGFYQCQRSATDTRYPKYPRLPVIQCPGYEEKNETAEPPG
jgi:hypothetical protein